MPVNAYIKEIDKRKQIAVESFDNITDVEKALINGAFNWLTDNLEVTNGNVVITEDIHNQMNDFVKAVVDIINNNKDFKKLFSSYLSDINIISSNLGKFHLATNKINLKKAGVTQVQKGVVKVIVDEFKDSGLNRGFAQPLKDVIYRNIVGGMSLREARGYLNDFIASGKDSTGKLKQYLTQTAQQGVDSYTGAINTKLGDTFKFTGFIISGSLIETSSLQCRYAVEHADTKGFLDNEQWQKILKMAEENKAAKLIEGTTLKNLPIRKLHWGCRHEFTPFL